MVIDNRIVQAEAGDVEAARELIDELVYSLTFEEPLPESITKYFAERLRKIAAGADANKELHLISSQGRPSTPPDRADFFVRLVIDKMMQGIPKHRAFNELDAEGKCTYMKNGKEESLSGKQISRIFKEWAPRLYPQARLKEFEAISKKGKNNPRK